MAIKIYIVTFKKTEVLNNNLRTLWAATQNPEDISVTILSNHSECPIYPENMRPNLRVVFNTTRMPNAWAYLSRDWNYGILDCFSTWRNPNNIDWCVLAQNDVEWVPGWDEWLRRNKQYDFVSQPRGDQSMCLNIEAVKKIGFFDEHFMTLHFQEHDYFMRAVCKLDSRASVNDDHAMAGTDCCWNPVGCVITKATFSVADPANDQLHTAKTWRELRNYIFRKWGLNDIRDVENKQRLRGAMTKTLQNYPKEVNWYPFFWDGFEYNDFLPIYNDHFHETKKVLRKVRDLLFRK